MKDFVKSENKEIETPSNQSAGKVSLVSTTFYEQQGPLKAFISRFVFRPQDVDDIAQETFIRAFKAEKTRSIEHPKAYIYRIARNLALKELTKKSTRMTSFIEDSCSQKVLRSDEDVEKQIGTLQKLDRVKQAISELPPQCQRVFIMRKVYGFSHKEISKQLGISVSTVEKHIVSGLKRCKQSVSRQETPSAVHNFKDTSSIKITGRRET